MLLRLLNFEEKSYFSLVCVPGTMTDNLKAAAARMQMLYEKRRLRCRRRRTLVTILIKCAKMQEQVLRNNELYATLMLWNQGKWTL